MACLVPDFPAVLLTLEHLSELEKQLKNEDIPFREEASHHLREISTAIKELEASRKAAHEQLEVQTIENGKMRHYVRRVRDAITMEMRDDVAAARDVNVTLLNQLQSDLKRHVEEIASVQAEQITLEEKNADLYKLREPMRKQHANAIRQLNHVLSEKARDQIQLNKKLNEIENLKAEIDGVEEAREELRLDIAQEREKFKEAKGAVQAQIQEQMNCNQQQKTANIMTRRELNSLVSERYQTDAKEAGLRASIDHIQMSKNKLTVERKTLKEKLAMERKRVEEYKKERALREKELAEVKETFRKKQQSLQQNVAESVNEIKRCKDMSEIQAAKIDGLMKYFNMGRKVEDNVMAEHSAIYKRMQWSKLKLEERISSMAKYKMEIREMEQSITMLEDTSEVNSELLARGLEITEQQLKREQDNRVEHEEEIESLAKALEELKVGHEERMRQLQQDTVQTEQRSQQLQHEEKKLQSHVYLSSIIDRLKQMIASTKQATKDMEGSYNEEIKGIEEETAVVSQQHEELQELLKAELAVLSSVEGEFDFDQSRHVNLTKETAGDSHRKPTHESGKLVAKAQGKKIHPVMDSAKTVASNAGEKPHQCTTCEKAFACASLLRVHQRVHTGEKPYQCTVCARAFAQAGGLRTHLMTHTGERPFKCVTCGKAFAQRASLQKHLDTHTGEKKYQCTLCGRAFTQKDSLQIHMNIHTGGKKHQCTLCGQAFAHRCSLKYHLTIHSGEKPFKCTTCEKAFSHPRSLRAHQSTHAGEKQKKTFSQNTQDLQDTHTGQNLHTCATCGKAFSRKESLQRHQATHTGQKPFECHTCGKAFARACQLNIHKMTHTGLKPFRCEACGAAFSQAGNLRTHQLIHTGERPYQCETCGKAFRSKGELKSHHKYYTTREKHHKSMPHLERALQK